MELLRFGSRGDKVVLWQEFLRDLGFYNGRISGIFGKLTEEASRKFQDRSGLVVDGIVGINTFSAAFRLGFLTSDNNNEEEIFKKYFLPENEYGKSEGDYRWICLHHTAGWNNPYNVINSWGRDNRGIVATEFVIGGQRITNSDSQYDGEILQAFPEGNFGWHLGIGNNFKHRNTVGIELCNFGYLTKGGFFTRQNGRNVFVDRKKDHFYTYVGTEISPDSNQVVELTKEFRGFKFWHKYSDLQINQTKKLLEFISKRNNIDLREGLPNLIREKGVEAFDLVDRRMCESRRSVWSHTNYTMGKYDVFPQPEMIDMLLTL